MSEQANVELVKSIYANFKEGNITGLLDAFAEDAEWSVPTVKGTPWAPLKGRVQMQEFFQGLEDAEEALEFTQDSFIAQGDKVVVEGRYRARVKATERIMETSYVNAMTIRDGKIQRLADYFDTAAVGEAYRKGASAGV